MQTLGYGPDNHLKIKVTARISRTTAIPQ